VVGRDARLNLIDTLRADHYRAVVEGLVDAQIRKARRLNWYRGPGSRSTVPVPRRNSPKTPQFELYKLI
jgi:hypothetical protein